MSRGALALTEQLLQANLIRSDYPRKLVWSMTLVVYAIMRAL